MLLKSNSIKSKLWIYLIIFSISILCFLWLFQVIFLNKYYEWYKTKSLNTAASKVQNNFESKNDLNTYEEIAHDYGICIEISTEYVTLYASNTYNKGCGIMIIGPNSLSYKDDFINSNTNSKQYSIINPRFNNKTLVYAMKLGNNYYGYISASLEPLDATITILKNQLLIVTLIVLTVSSVLAYYISKKISKPIIKISNTAKELGSGNHNVIFDNNNEIAEINELADTLNYANSELSKTDQLRRDLLANVSHDLKTPLTMIKAYAEMVRDLTYKNKEKRTENLNVIIEESDRLNILVNDILTLSSMQAKTDKLEVTHFNITELINNILNKYHILKETEGYNFIFEETKEIYISADKKRIEQVIYNLVNNAINYTGTDNKVTIELVEEETNLRIEISDTGKGIKEEDIPYIWDKYYHTEKKHKRNLVGTGLGLSIVKNILENHKFEYGVTSKKNKGTTFYFIVPYIKN